jgi:TonB-dependent Receptor Plug Domain
MKLRCTTPDYIRRTLMVPAFFVFVLGSLHAQTTTPPATEPTPPADATAAKKTTKPLTKEEQAAIDQTGGPSDTKGKDAIVLSPFEVNSGDEHGYSASNSLSGTRLNSKLEDISGSISVITKQQLLDTAALDLNDIFQYEIGTEGTAQFTDPTNDGRGNYDNVAGNPTGANRMRGLSQANILVNGFTAASSIPIDPYNIDAIEIARGPNSTLAGLSDAGGSVNIVAGRANVTRETTSVQTRVDSYDGYRFVIDLNRPIIRNKLGLRFSAVYGEVGYVRKPSDDRTDRQSFGLTYRPFKSTTLSASFERFNEWASRANALTPRDTITNWRNNGSPTYNSVTQTYTVRGVTGAPITTMTNNVPAGIALLGSSNVRNLQFIDDGKINYITPGGRPSNTASAVDQFTESSGVAAAGPLYTLPGITNKSLYDWTKINLLSANYEIQHARTSTLNLDQGIFDTDRNRLDLNLGWRREDVYRYSRQYLAQQDGVPAVLEMDTNERLVDGRPNPFFLHPFIGGLAPQTYERPLFADNYRAQLAYQIDLRREKSLLKWLGFHRLNGYGEQRETIQSPSGLRYHDEIIDNTDFLGTAAITPTTNFTGAAGALFFPLYYMGKTPGAGVQYANKGPTNPSGKFVASSYNTTTATWNVSDPVTVQDVYFSQLTQKKIIRTEGLSLQDFFAEDRIVTTFGVRKDRNYTIDPFNPTLANGFFSTDNLYNFGVNKKYNGGTTRTKGVVVKPFRNWAGIDRIANGGGIESYFAEAVRGLNFYYNDSNSFLPADTVYNLYLTELPNPTSTGKEYGVMLNMFGKFSLRLTHQETIQLNTRAGTGTIATRVLGMDFHPGGQNLTFNLFDAESNPLTGWQVQLHPEYTAQQALEEGAKAIGYTLDYINNAANKSFGDASNATSKGWELEVQFNPNRYWTNKITGNQQVAIDSNISTFIQKYINQRLPIWTTIKAPDGSLWWDTTQGSNGTPHNYYTINIQSPLNLAITTQGKKKPQTREYTLNYLTAYQLAGLGGLASDHTWIKNMSVGGSYRWSSQGAIGYLAGAPDSDGVVRNLDGTKPVYDKARDSASVFTKYRTKLFHNRIGTTFQLNVNNVTESGRLQPVAVNPDGTPWNYRIIDPRQYIFSVSFDL